MKHLIIMSTLFTALGLTACDRQPAVVYVPSTTAAAGPAGATGATGATGESTTVIVTPSAESSN